MNPSTYHGKVSETTGNTTLHWETRIHWDYPRKGTYITVTESGQLVANKEILRNAWSHEMNLVKSQLHLRGNNKQWKYYWTTNEQPEGIVYGNTNAIPSLGKETGIYKQLYVHTTTICGVTDVGRSREPSKLSTITTTIDTSSRDWQTLKTHQR